MTGCLAFVSRLFRPVIRRDHTRFKALHWSGEDFSIRRIESRLRRSDRPRRRLRYEYVVSMSSTNVGPLGRQRSFSAVSRLDDGLSTRRNIELKLKCRFASFSSNDFTGRPSLAPIAWAMSFIATPDSPTPWMTVPGSASSMASRNRRAASLTCTAGNRFVPSPS